MCKGYGSCLCVCLCVYLCVCVCVSVCYHVSFVCKSQVRYQTYGFYRVALAENALFQSSGIINFNDHHCFPHFLMSSRWTEETAR